MKKYQPTDLIKFASRTGRWTVKKINNMPTLYTTNLGSYLRFKVSNAKKCQISVLPNQNSLSPSQVFAFRIDGGKWQRAQASLEKIDIPLDFSLVDAYLKLVCLWQYGYSGSRCLHTTI